MSKKFIILQSSEISNSLIDLAIETSSDTLRWNKDRSKTFLKFETVPSQLSDKTQLTKEEMKEELLKDSWNV
tara:strand:+ start:177 stop:392 length:216 start_codon:yes stop_codon:yes gene_type:complete